MSKNSISLDLCISGASISRCPWTTWVDFLKECLCTTKITDHSCKGAGNHYIIRSAIHSLRADSGKKFMAIMLTNFDKYDMWVKGSTCQELRHEKHAPHWIDGTQSSQQGFWCTGSHFPLIKQVYQENFFDIEIAAAQDLTNLLGLVKFCQDRDVAFLIMFDSPVFRYSEYQINDHCRNQAELVDIRLTDSVMIDPLLDVLSPYILDQSGLIGFCIERDLPWYNSKYGPHPPSLSHYLYFQERILPWIYAHYPDLELAQLDSMQLPMAEKMTTKWNRKEF